MTINLDKARDFLYDNNGKIHTPKWFDESNISKDSKDWFKFLILTFLATLDSTIYKFEKRIDNLNIPFDRSVINSLIELEQSGYISTDIEH